MKSVNCAPRRVLPQKYWQRALCLVVVLLTLTGCMAYYSISVCHVGEDTAAPTAATVETQTMPLPDLSATELPAAELQQCYLYGTTFQVAITLPQEAAADNEAVLVLSMGENRCSWPLTLQEDGCTLALSSLINEGVDIQQLPEGEGCFTLQLKDSAGNTTQWRLQATQQAAARLPLTRYTVTRDNANQQVTFTAGESSLCLCCQAQSLPQQVYDIVLDPGHGAADGGSVWGDICEKDVVLQIAQLTKTALEQRGYKVFLTRDGSEDPETMMAYTMYDPDGRVNTTQASGAKLCLSLHLNSLDEYVSAGGVQIYAADKMNYSFAALLAQHIAAATGTRLSDMDYYRIADGVFCRTMVQQDLDELEAYAQRKHFTPFDIPLGTNFYYIIRETGASITGAYMDGRNPDYGANLYLDSNIGVETYLCELGFLNVEADRALLLQNPQSYAEGIANAVDARFAADSD